MYLRKVVPLTNSKTVFIITSSNVQCTNIGGMPMYYSSGNYEAFARPLKPEGVDNKSAYLVGAGLASLAAAFFLVRDAQMPGNKIHILEGIDIPGGSCDGIEDADRGFIMRGGREMEDHFECLWDLFRSVPSLETEGATVLDEFYWLNKADPNSSLMRVTEKRGQSANTNKTFKLSQEGMLEILNLFLTKETDLQDKKIEDVFTDEFFSSNFWTYWRSMFAFETWHSALEMRRYVQRFIHHLDGIGDLSAVKFTKYNQYESLILPLVKYLEERGVQIQYNTMVTNVLFDITPTKKVAKQIVYTQNGEEKTIDLTENDLVFVTNGSATASSTMGDENTVPEFKTDPGPAWALWKNIAKQDPAFGRPEKFCSNPELSNWESATITLLDTKIYPYIEKICQRELYTGKVVTGGIITARDSNWLLSYSVSRQPHFASQPKDKLVVWFYALFSDKPGDFIKKAMKDCTGNEIVQEWLYHMGVPESEITTLAAESTRCIPYMMPYITTYFMPRREGDRPKIVPQGCTNFAFLGQFADTERDTVFTVEYSVRTGMEAVYTLLDVDRGVPEVFASEFDLRTLVKSVVLLADGKKLTDYKLPFSAEMAKKTALKKIEGTMIEEMLKEYGAI